jgi:hypothetical protein
VLLLSAQRPDKPRIARPRPQRRPYVHWPRVLALCADDRAACAASRRGRKLEPRPRPKTSRGQSTGPGPTLPRFQCVGEIGRPRSDDQVSRICGSVEPKTDADGNQSASVSRTPAPKPRQKIIPDFSGQPQNDDKSQPTSAHCPLKKICRKNSSASSRARLCEPRIDSREVRWRKGPAS